MIRNVKVTNRSWRYRPAAGFDATCAVQQQHASSAPRKIMSGSRSGRAAANDDDIELFVI
jgi:hypothetical protein